MENIVKMSTEKNGVDQAWPYLSGWHSNYGPFSQDTNVKQTKEEECAITYLYIDGIKI